MRAAWVSTVYNMDWPKTKSNISKQKQEYTTLLDQLKSIGINTVVFQVRPKADALYSSNINPWSDVLTGTQGKNPGYDPLAFAIDEAHKRGMDLHAWLNPYRVTTSGTSVSSLAANSPARLHPDWLLQYNSGSSKALMYNPGLPQVRQHIIDTVSEIVRNYNVDGIHFDDYFYREGMDDTSTYNKYGSGLSKSDWRRNNVNILLREVKSSIKSIKSNVQFGVSPSGIWRNKSSDPTGSDTRGFEHYSQSYADSRTWIRQGLVDYIVPQIYWTIGYSSADYSKLVSWWSNEVKGHNVNLYIGQGVYRQGGSDSLNIAAEIKQQVNLNRKYKEIKGSIYFSASDIIKNPKLKSDMKELYSTDTSIPDKPSSNIIGIKVVNASSLNVRSGPGTSYSKIGSISNGTKVEVISESNGWSKINYGSSVGYLSTDYLSGFIQTSKFTDITGHWAENEIRLFIDKGFINGYEDKTFKPNNSITRAEFVKIFNRVFGLTNKSGKVFEDTKGNWAKDEIDIAVTNGVCQGISDTKFAPNSPITREQAAVMVSNYKKIADDNLDKLSKYKDVNNVSDWAKASVEGVIEKGYMQGNEGNFMPKKNITRAEAVVTLSRVKK